MRVIGCCVGILLLACGAGVAVPVLSPEQLARAKERGALFEQRHALAGAFGESSESPASGISGSYRLDRPSGDREPRLHETLDAFVFVLSGHVRVTTARGVRELVAGESMTLARGEWYVTESLGEHTGSILFMFDASGEPGSEASDSKTAGISLP